jgi:hypothetical protein
MDVVDPGLDALAGPAGAGGQADAGRSGRLQELPSIQWTAVSTFHSFARTHSYPTLDAKSIGD